MREELVDVTTTASPAPDLNTLRAQVRAAQHARSFPLLVLGGLLVSYGVVAFQPNPVAWRYAAPLAFVLVWGLAKVNEHRVGVGVGRADYLAAGGFVFVATNAVLLRPFSSWLNLYQLEGSWVAILGIALGAVAWATRDRLLTGIGLGLTGIGVAIVIANRGSSVAGFFKPGTLPLPGDWPNQTIALVGVAGAVAGLLFYRRERRFT